MGEVATETVRQIEETRQRIESNLHQLEERLPVPTKVARKAGAIAIGSGAGGTAFWFVVRRIRKSRAKKAQRPVINIMPRQFVALFGDDEGKAILAAAGGLWVLFRLIQMRQLRKLRLATGR